MKSCLNAILFFITVYFGTVAFADSVPPWMALVESKYKCDEKIVKEPCVGSIHGAGILIYVPAKEKDITTPHYYVITDAHLSNGNFGSDSLKLFSRYNSHWLQLIPLKSGNRLARLSDNYYDIDIIEVEKPLGIPGESMFQFTHVPKTGNSYFWVKDEINGKGYNEVVVAQDLFVVAPPELSQRPREFRLNTEQVTGISTAEMLRSLQEPVRGLNLTTFGDELMTQSHIVNGMSGSPLLKRIEGNLLVLGLSKRYHRFYNRSYFSTYSQLTNLFWDYNRRYLESQNEQADPDRFSWSFIPSVGTFVKDSTFKASEISYVSRNSGSFEVSNSGNDKSWSLSKTAQEMFGQTDVLQDQHSMKVPRVNTKRRSDSQIQLQQKGNFDSSFDRGGHDTSDGGAGSTVSLLDSDVKTSVQLQPGMEFKNEPIIGFSVKASISSGGVNKKETFNIFANMEAYNFIAGFASTETQKLEKYTVEEMEVNPIRPFVNLVDLFKNKVKNFPLVYSPFGVEEELRRVGYYKNDLQDELLKTYTQQHESVELNGSVAICLINATSFRKLSRNAIDQKLEIALFRFPKSESPTKNEILNSYYSVEVPLRLSWLQGFSRKAKNISKLEPEVIIDTKGLFLVNVADPVCPKAFCPFLFDLNKTPYLTFKWKERKEAEITNCFVLDNDSFFENLRSQRLRIEDL